MRKPRGPSRVFAKVQGLSNPNQYSWGQLCLPAAVRCPEFAVGNHCFRSLEAFPWRAASEACSAFLAHLVAITLQRGRWLLHPGLKCSLLNAVGDARVPGSVRGPGAWGVGLPKEANRGQWSPQGVLHGFRRISPSHINY